MRCDALRDDLQYADLLSPVEFQTSTSAGTTCRDVPVLTYGEHVIGLLDHLSIDSAVISVLTTLPSPLDPNTIYICRTGIEHAEIANIKGSLCLKYRTTLSISYLSSSSTFYTFHKQCMYLS
jgi:hypothetical protein